MNLDNCPRCGRVFAKGFRDVCPTCVRGIDKEYEKCAEYLRQNKGAAITELSEETEVSIRQITQFIREGRISLVDAPNLSYPCESCGVYIRENHLCDSCRKRLTKSTQQLRSTYLSSSSDNRQSEVGLSYKGISQYKGRTNK